MISRIVMVALIAVFGGGVWEQTAGSQRCMAEKAGYDLRPVLRSVAARCGEPAAVRSQMFAEGLGGGAPGASWGCGLRPVFGSVAARCGEPAAATSLMFAEGFGGGTPEASRGCGLRSALPTSQVFAGSVGRQGRGPARSERSPAAVEEELGLVYMYGELMEKPYVFTNVGGDTLYLNGVPYHPVRGPVNRWEQLSESEKRRLLAKGHHAFADSVWTIVRAMHDSGATYEECLDAYAEMYRASPRVLSVRKEKTWVTVTWADGTEEESIIDFEPGAPPRTMEEVHKDLMEEFWRDVRAGTMIAKGYVDDLTYTIFSPRPDIAKMKRLIERLAAGDTLSTEETMGTPLADKLFRADVARRVARSKQGEE